MPSTGTPTSILQQCDELNDAIHKIQDWSLQRRDVFARMPVQEQELLAAAINNVARLAQATTDKICAEFDSIGYLLQQHAQQHRNTAADIRDLQEAHGIELRPVPATPEPVPPAEEDNARRTWDRATYELVFNDHLLEVLRQIRRSCFDGARMPAHAAQAIDQILAAQEAWKAL
jgi:hypothetical protein